MNTQIATPAPASWHSFKNLRLLAGATLVASAATVAVWQGVELADNDARQASPSVIVRDAEGDAAKLLASLNAQGVSLAPQPGIAAPPEPTPADDAAAFLASLGYNGVAIAGHSQVASAGAVAWAETLLASLAFNGVTAAGAELNER